jgi:hypothetical protein
LLTQFEALEVDPAEFGHREHLQVAFEMLHKYGYLDASSRYANAINTMATNAGAADKFNVTITFAYLSLIAERMHADPQLDFEAFLANNPDLMSGSALDRWYSSEELASDFARTHFLLPGKVA